MCTEHNTVGCSKQQSKGVVADVVRGENVGGSWQRVFEYLYLYATINHGYRYTQSTKNMHKYSYGNGTILIRILQLQSKLVVVLTMQLGLIQIWYSQVLHLPPLLYKWKVKTMEITTTPMFEAHDQIRVVHSRVSRNATGEQNYSYRGPQWCIKTRQMARASGIGRNGLLLIPELCLLQKWKKTAVLCTIWI